MHFFSKRKSKSCKLLCSAVRGLLLESSCGCLILCIGSFLRPLVGTLSLSLSKVFQPHRVGRAVRRPFIIDLQCKSPPKRRSHRSIGSWLRAPSSERIMRTYLVAKQPRCRQNSSRSGQILQPGKIVTTKDEISLLTILVGVIFLSATRTILPNTEAGSFCLPLCNCAIPTFLVTFLAYFTIKNTPHLSFDLSQ